MKLRPSARKKDRCDKTFFRFSFRCDAFRLSLKREKPCGRKTNRKTRTQNTIAAFVFNENFEHTHTHTHNHTPTHPQTHTHTHTHTHTPKWLTWAATAHKVIPVFANVECQKRKKTAKTQPDQILVFRVIHIKGVTLHLESASTSSRSSYSLHTGPEVTDTMCLPKKH